MIPSGSAQLVGLAAGRLLRLRSVCWYLDKDKVPRQGKEDQVAGTRPWWPSRSHVNVGNPAIHHKPTILGMVYKVDTIPALCGDFRDDSDLSLGLRVYQWFTHVWQGHSDPTGAGFTRDSWQDLQSSRRCGGTWAAWRRWEITVKWPWNPSESHETLW